MIGFMNQSQYRNAATTFPTRAEAERAADDQVAAEGENRDLADEADEFEDGLIDAVEARDGDVVVGVGVLAAC